MLFKVTNAPSVCGAALFFTLRTFSRMSGPRPLRQLNQMVI